MNGNCLAQKRLYITEWSLLYFCVCMQSYVAIYRTDIDSWISLNSILLTKTKMPGNLYFLKEKPAISFKIKVLENCPWNFYFYKKLGTQLNINFQVY